MYCTQCIGYVQVRMLSRPHHDNHKFMCLQNAITIVHTTLFVCEKLALVFFENTSMTLIMAK